MASGFVFVDEILAAPETQLLPIEVARAWTRETIGVDLEQVESVMVAVGVPGPDGVQVGAVVRLSEDWDLAQLNPEIVGGPAESVAGHQAVPVADVPDLYVHQVDARTVIVARRGYLEEMMAAGESPSGPLASLVSRLPRIAPVMVTLATEPIRPQVNQAAAQAAAQLPPPLRDLTELPNLLDGIVVSAGVSADDKKVLMMLATSDEAAEEAERILNAAIEMGRQIAVAQMVNEVRGEGPIADASREYFQRLGNEIAAMLKPQRNGRRLMIEVDQVNGATATIGVMGGMLVPAISSARTAARRMQSSNNVKQIMLSFHNFHDTFNQLPPAIARDEEGNALLSWRVHVLPYLGEHELYDQFRLDEPWDSEHNSKLLERMPEVYRHPDADTEPGMTVYQVPVGEDYMFTPDGATHFRDITDGLSNTIAVVETNVASAVPWTKPEDIEIDPLNPTAKMGDMSTGGFNVGMGDGSVRFINNMIDPSVFLALLTRAGGEAVGGF